MMRKLIIPFMTLILLLAAYDVSASHNRAGEIIYERTGSSPFEYTITIITYTKTGGQSDDADRCELELFFGDGTREYVSRVNGNSGSSCNHIGEQITTNTKKNIYTTTHTYPGAGIFKVYMQDQNRNAGVKNIPSSDNVWFYIESEIVIDVSSGGNTAPTLQNAPIDNGCVKEIYYHNPGAVDPDGDSLVYSIVSSKTANGQSIPGFVLPNAVSGSSETLTIDERTGTLKWDSPQVQGEFNIAIRIEEWRYNVNSGALVFVGSILRDMQIDIQPCEPKEPPIISDMRKTCVEAGKVLRVLARVTDGDNDAIDFSATGFPLNSGEGGSLSPDGIIGQPQPVEMEFIWNTRCDHVQFESYWVYFKAKENLGLSDEELVDFEELEIQVVAPPVQILNVSPKGAALELNWTNAPCEGGDGYEIYRYNDSLGYIGKDCNTGVPGALGYELIGRNEGLENRTFLDDNDGAGLIHGERYCYMIVVTYPDRSESYASLEACGELIRDVPIINTVSITETDAEIGSDTVAWYKPIELDPSAYPGPYAYQLLRANEAAGPFESIFVSDKANDFLTLDTHYVDTQINTEEQQFFYSVELLWGADQESVGKSRNAASIYLSSTPADNQLTLSWDVQVPWTIVEYIVYRYKTHPDSMNLYDEIGRTTETTFIDKDLVNLVEYSYLIRSIGAYSSGLLSDTLYNYSQIHTGVPKDLNAPCTPPNRVINGDCNLDQTTLIWNNPNTYCPDVDDVVAYNIYFAPQLGIEMDLIQVNDNPLDTSFLRLSDESLAGCYVVTSIDSFGNESDSGSAMCVDNCPVYRLPNVFTPGGDGVNDFFIPYPYKFIESIDLTIFNRWGNIVFETTDPDINWDGKEKRTGRQVPDGAYYYLCTVNEVRLVGIVQRELKGSFTIINEGEKQIAK